MKILNQVWNFFASVKLALFTICAIAITSIIGTVIPQNNSFAFYAERYGDNLARFFFLFDFQEMYTSYWFLALLGLLSVNLVICSLDRFPAVWRQIVADQTQVSGNKLESMPFKSYLTSKSSQNEEVFSTVLKKEGWKTQLRKENDSFLISGQKGAWTRTGVYIVHASILIIFLGATVGYFLGFKGSVMIPETKQTSKIFSHDTQQPIELGFDVRCDFFDIEFYDNGMPKEYTSRLVVIEEGKEVLKKEIEVNKPLVYNGITFYQASYEGYRDFVINIKDPTDNSERTFVVPYQQQTIWKEKNIRFGVIKAEVIRDRVVRSKVWLQAGDNTPAEFWIESTAETDVKQGDGNITISVKQMYATGLQVAKDPGVWLVYLGFFLMMLGLYLAFFMSHQRIWVYGSTTAKNNDIILAGTTNKNKIGFEKMFSQLTASVEDAATK